ncbi:MAG: 50S ribosomal protein L11 methyltransferase [Actinomycetota bacterium]
MAQVLVLRVAAHEADAATGALWGIGINALEERLVDGAIELRTVVGDAHLPTIVDVLAARWTVAVETVDGEPAETWKDFATAVEVDDIVLNPAWLAPPDQGLVVSIDPGAAFGLGDHPTTRLSTGLVARRVRSLIAGGARPRVLDVGCGTGVLAIVAAVLGAGTVVATDVSSAAVEVARSNVVANRVDDVVTVVDTPSGSIDGRFDVVVANILAPTLIELADDLRSRCCGSLIVSGLLEDQVAKVETALRPWVAVDRRVLDGWAAIELSADERVDRRPSGQ